MMKAALSESPIGIFTTDDQLVVRSWDEWLASVTGISAVEASGAALDELVPDFGERGLLARFKNVLSGVVEVLAPAFHHYLIPCPPVSPSKRFSHMRQRVIIAPLREDDRIVGTMVTVEDVTARMEKERDIAEQLHSADEEARLQAAEALSREDWLETVQPLMGALSDESWRVRRAAAAGLGRRRDSEAVAGLLRALRFEHRNLSVLNSALQVLSMMDMDIVTPLVDFLKDADTELRIYAALALGESRNAGSIPALIEALNDSDANVRYHAIESLGKLEADSAVEVLASIAESGDFFLAFPALDALMRIGNPRVCARIVALLKDELLRESAAEALGKLGDQDVVEPLVKFLGQPDAPAAVVAHALASLFERYERLYWEGAYITDLVQRSIDETGTDNLIRSLDVVENERLRSLVTVLGWLDDPRVERALIGQLGRPEVRKETIEALVRYGKKMTGPLIQQLGSDDPDTRRQAVTALARIGDVTSVPALVETLKKDPELTVAAANALAQLGDPGAFEALLEFLGHPDAAVRLAVISALNAIAHPDMPARMARLLTHENSRLRDSAVRIAGYFGYPECADLLLERCRDRDEAVRIAAVEHIPYLEDERVVSTLLEALRSGSPKVRAAAVRSMTNLDEELALPHLVSALGDPDEWVRYFAARSIGKCNFERMAPSARSSLTRALIGLVEEEPADHVRAAAVATLGRIGDVSFVGLIAPLLRSENRDLVRAALEALGRIDQGEALPYLMTALHSLDAILRVDAVRALGGCHTKEAVAALQWAAKDREPLVCRHAIKTLGSMATADSIAALLQITLDERHRDAAIETLAGLGEAKIEEIVAGLRSNDPAMRRAILEVLARMKRPRATRWIVGALEDKEPAVRLTAIRSLRILGSRLGDGKLRELARSDPEMNVRDAALSSLRAS